MQLLTLVLIAWSFFNALIVSGSRRAAVAPEKLRGRGGFRPPQAINNNNGNNGNNNNNNNRNNNKLFILFDSECVSSRDEVELILSSIESQFTCLKEDFSKNAVIYYNDKLNEYHAYLKITNNGNCLDSIEIDYEQLCIKYFDYELIAKSESVKLICNEDMVSYTFDNNQYMWNWDALDSNLDELSDMLATECDNNDNDNGFGIAHKVDIYVFDTGILSTHNEFKNINFQRLSDFDDNQLSGNHGTHVGGIIIGENVGIARSISSIATLYDMGPNLEWQTLEDNALLMLKNMAKKGSSTRSVINFSFGVYFDATFEWLFDRIFNEYIDIATNKYNAIIVASAGNSGIDACNHYPSFLENIISVGASDENNDAASYSNYGDCVDIYAPGSNIYSSIKDSDNSYANYYGTSMASPYISGIIVEMLSINNKLNFADIKNILLNNNKLLNDDSCQSGPSTCKQIKFNSCNDMFNKVNQEKYIDVCDTSRTFTWYEAQEYCMNIYGTSLASIHSEADDIAFQSIRSQNDYGYWIGLRLIKSSNLNYDIYEYKWSDGTNYDYELNNWRENNPDFSSNTGNNCVQSHGIGWNTYDDADCDSDYWRYCFACNKY